MIEGIAQLKSRLTFAPLSTEGTHKKHPEKKSQKKSLEGLVKNKNLTTFAARFARSTKNKKYDALEGVHFYKEFIDRTEAKGKR